MVNNLSPSKVKTVENYALEYSQHGYSIVPLPYGTKVADTTWREFQSRRPTDSEINTWFGNNQAKNLAIVCGKVSGGDCWLVVIEFDVPSNYESFCSLAEKRLGLVLRDITPVVKTARGYHVYWLVKTPVKSTKFPTCEIRSDGNYVLAPPSKHPSGNLYELINPEVTIPYTINSLLDIGIDLTQKPTQSTSKGDNWVTEALKGVPEGQRNETGLRLAGYLKNKHPQDITLSFLQGYAQKCRPPLPESEVAKIVQSAYSYIPKTNSKLKSLSEVIKSAPQYQQGLCGDIIQREGITIISGSAGDGKTTFIYNLSASASKGQKFLTFEIAQPLRVLYYDLESPESLIKRRCELIKDIDLNNVFIGRFDNFRTDYNRIAEEARGFDIVVIDPISLAFQTAKEEDNAEASRQMKLLRKFVTDTKVALILIHHIGKVAQGKSVYKLRGATARAAESDIVINLEAITEDVCKLEVAKNRFVGGNLILYVRKAEGRFELTKVKDYADSTEMFKAQSDILSFLQGKAIVARKDIVTVLPQHNDKTIDRAITYLLQTSKIDKPGYGQYCLRDNNLLPPNVDIVTV